MALFEIAYYDSSNNQERIEAYRIDTMLLDGVVSSDDLYDFAIRHAKENKKHQEYISRIEFISW